MDEFKRSISKKESKSDNAIKKGIRLKGRKRSSAVNGRHSLRNSTLKTFSSRERGSAFLRELTAAVKSRLEKELIDPVVATCLIIITQRIVESPVPGLFRTITSLTDVRHLHRFLSSKLGQDLDANLKIAKNHKDSTTHLLSGVLLYHLGQPDNQPSEPLVPYQLYDQLLASAQLQEPELVHVIDGKHLDEERKEEVVAGCEKDNDRNGNTISVSEEKVEAVLEMMPRVNRSTLYLLMMFFHFLVFVNSGASGAPPARVVVEALSRLLCKPKGTAYMSLRHRQGLARVEAVVHLVVSRFPSLREHLASLRTPTASATAPRTGLTSPDSVLRSPLRAMTAESYTLQGNEPTGMIKSAATELQDEKKNQGELRPADQQSKVLSSPRRTTGESDGDSGEGDSLASRRRSSSHKSHGSTHVMRSKSEPENSPQIIVEKFIQGSVAMLFKPDQDVVILASRRCGIVWEDCTSASQAGGTKREVEKEGEQKEGTANADASGVSSQIQDQSKPREQKGFVSSFRGDNAPVDAFPNTPPGPPQSVPKSTSTGRQIVVKFQAEQLSPTDGTTVESKEQVIEEKSNSNEVKLGNDTRKMNQNVEDNSPNNHENKNFKENNCLGGKSVESMDKDSWDSQASFVQLPTGNQHNTEKTKATSSCNSHCDSNDAEDTSLFIQVPKVASFEKNEPDLDNNNITWTSQSLGDIPSSRESSTFGATNTKISLPSDKMVDIERKTCPRDHGLSIELESKQTESAAAEKTKHNRAGLPASTPEMHSRPSERKHQVAACKAMKRKLEGLTNHCEQFSHPSQEILSEISQLKNQYRSAKRQIRNDAAIQIQSIVRSFCARNRILCEAECAKKVDAKDIIRLEMEKKNIKKELRKFDEVFERKHGRKPTRKEKEPIRDLYETYNVLKHTIQELTKVVGDRVQRECQVNSQTLSIGAQHESQANSKALSSTPKFSGEQSRDSGSTHSTPLSEKSSSAMENPAKDPGWNNIVSYKELVAEKKSLQARLRNFEKQFEVEHGRKVKYASDIRGREDEYRRYKLLKSQIAACKNGGETATA